MSATSAPASRATDDALEVDVVYAAPGVEAIIRVRVPRSAVVAEAVAASGLLDRHALDPRTIVCAIFGERVAASTPLAAGDRVELTRPLIADAKAARKARAAARPLPRMAPRPKRHRTES